LRSNSERLAKCLPALAAAVLGLWLLFDRIPAIAQAADEDLRSQVEALAAAEGFAVSGLDRIGAAPARAGAAGKAERQLKSLLRSYNYILLHDADGRIAELRISGLRAPAAAVTQRYAVPTTRRGRHHLVDSELSGPDGVRRKVQLIVDTGATSVVLPLSMTETLGFRAEDLKDGWAQTAGGRVPVKSARLGLVKVGRAQSRDVAVTFIDDEKIEGQALLGMSFLERYRLTVEDNANRIILMAK